MGQRMTSTSKADEEADAVKFAIKSQPIQSAAAVSYARQVETANEQTTLKSQYTVIHDVTSHQAASLAQQSEQFAFESSPETSKSDVTSTIEAENGNDDRIAEFDLKLMQIESEHMEIPEQKYNVIAKLTSNEFQKICRDLKEFW